MNKAGRSIRLLLGLALMLLPACSRQPGLLSLKEDAHSPPFNNSSRSGGISPTQAFASISIPAGTTIVVRVQSALSSLGSRSGDQFEAVLDGPIVVQEQVLVPGGTAITGRVLTAEASGPRQPGYLRLTLSSLMLNGKAVDVHSSTVFCKAGLREHPKSAAGGLPSGSTPSGRNDIQFSTGRRLTFRLIQPLAPPEVVPVISAFH